MPRDGAFFNAIFTAEPELLEPPKKKRAATPSEIAEMFGMSTPKNGDVKQGEG